MTYDPQDPPRWTATRKAAFLAALAAGRIGRAELERCGISLDELRGWQRDFAAYGTLGLRATFVPCRRRRPARPGEAAARIVQPHYS
jgi:hypothetical protein